MSAENETDADWLVSGLESGTACRRSMAIEDSFEIWRKMEHLTLREASALAAGLDPTSLCQRPDVPYSQMDVYYATIRLLVEATENNRLKAQIREHNCVPIKISDNLDPDHLSDVEFEPEDYFRASANHYYMPCTCKTDAIVKVPDLKVFFRAKGIRPDFFFGPDANLDPPYLNKEAACYAPKLAAAVRAWEAVSTDKNLTQSKSPKAALCKWLGENAASLRLEHPNGQPIESAIEEIAKVANWIPQGGAPKTGR